MPSLFRIDKNSLMADSNEPASIVKLPGFNDMLEQNNDEVEGAEPAPVTEEDPQDRVIDQKQQQIKQLEQQIITAQEQAKAILAQADDDAKRLADEAVKKGYEEGYNQAMASVRQEQAADHERVEQAVVALRDAKSEMFSQIAPPTVRWCMASPAASGS